MKKFRKTVISLVLIVCLLAGLTGCTTYTNFKNAFFADDPVATERTIKIGIFEPLSGENRVAGREETRGIELAHELYPTIAGKKVELVYGDNHSDMYVADTVIQELININQPSVILGSYGETMTLVASEYTQVAHIPAIAISSTNPLITSNNPYYFSATYSETRQGDALADFAFKAQNRDVVATVKLAQDDTAVATIKRFTNRIKKITGNNKCVVGNYSLPTSTTDYSRVIEAIRESGAKAVFLAVSPTVAQTFLQQAVDSNLTHVLYLGGRSWNDEKFLDMIHGSDKLNIAFPTEQSQRTMTDMSQAFLSAYRNRYGAESEPTELAALGFDAYLLAMHGILDAMSVVNSADPAHLVDEDASDIERRIAQEDWEIAMETGIPTGRQLREAISAIEDFEGASGVISYDGKNEVTKSITISYIQHGTDMPAYIVD